MKHFCYYFTEQKILYALVSKRIAVASKRHEFVFLDNIRHRSVNRPDKAHADNVVAQIFPPRDSWLRLSRQRRAEHINNPMQGLSKELYYTVLKAQSSAASTGIIPTWLKKLNDLISEIRKSMMEPLNLTRIKPTGYTYQPKNRLTKEHRVIVRYALKDNIIASLVTEYLTDHTDAAFDQPYFSDNSYAFRSSRIAEKGGPLFSYHLAAEKIEEFRVKNIERGIYVAEVDLAKFFDTVNHKILKDCLDRMARHFASLGKPIDPRALEIARNYLDSFSFNLDALPKEVTGKRIFKWPAGQLKKLGVDIRDEKIGVPQGGALSCFFANLIMHELDLIFPTDDPDLAYMRYCDDFIILHTSPRRCKEYVDLALSKIRELKLVAHSPDDYELTDYKKRIIKGRGKSTVNEFWNSSKSKNPYRWGPYDSEHRRNIPYVSFVGYQRRYDGLLRVRKKSLNKEYTKQKKLVNNILSRVKSEEDGEIKLNRRQIMFRAEQKLIAMSVGRMHLKNLHKKLGFCWSNGFRVMGSSPEHSDGQLKYLDRSRERELSRLRRELKMVNLKKRVGQPDTKIKRLYKPLTSYHAYFNHRPPKGL